MNDASTPSSVGSVTLRPATMADGQRLLEWRNHPSSRAQSPDSAAIPWEEHIAWLARVLADDDVILRIGVDGEGVPVGMVRANRHDEVAVFSVIVEPDARGGGVGTRMILAMEPQIAGQWPEVTRLQATVLAGNSASQKLFKALGYEVASLCLEKSVQPGRTS